MESSNGKYHIIAFLKINRPSELNYTKPFDDIVKWLHIELKNKHTIFYEIIEPDQAKYNEAFKAKISFLEKDLAKEINPGYSVYRGPEKIGSLKMIEYIT